MKELIEIHVVKGVEGDSLSIQYGDGYGRRIAGNKPWGGGTIIKTWKVRRESLIHDLEEVLRGLRYDPTTNMDA